jgi:hypothetical protein
MDGARRRAHDMGAPALADGGLARDQRAKILEADIFWE